MHHIKTTKFKKMKILFSLTFIFSVLLASASSHIILDNVQESQVINIWRVRASSHIILDNDGSKAIKETTTVTVKGIIIDSETKEPLVGVKVYINQNETAVYTDFEGNFELQTATKNKELKISYISYEETSYPLCDNNNCTLEIKQIN